MITIKSTQIVKATAFLLAASLLAPAAMLFGLSAAATVSLAIAIGLGNIALSDYGRSPTSYHTARRGKRSERHPLAA